MTCLATGLAFATGRKSSPAGRSVPAGQKNSTAGRRPAFLLQRVAEPGVEDEEPGHHAADEDGVVSSKPDRPQQVRGLTEQYGGKGRVVLAVMETVTSQ